jgi:hypothetical protein
MGDVNDSEATEQADVRLEAVRFHQCILVAGGVSSFGPRETRNQKGVETRDNSL